MNNTGKNSCSLIIPRKLDRKWVEKQPLHKITEHESVSVDLSSTEFIDSAGASFINLLKRKFGGGFNITKISPTAKDDLDKLIGRGISWSQTDEKQDNIFVNAGNSLVSFYSEGISALSVLTEIFYWSSFGILKRRDIRKGSLGDQMYLLGFNAIGIVSLLSFLVGVVLALQAAIQLKAYGADIFLAPLIGMTMIRELGPLITAIIMAGRTGSATTAEIATMVVQEELDALRTMSLNPVQLVVVPKFWAISITMPLLSIIAVATGILGGFIVAFFYLGISTSLFWNELAKSILLKDCIVSFSKSLIFSWLVIWIGAYYGFRVKGGAEAVGKNTTASVVTGIFIIIVTDAFLSFLVW